MGVLDKAKFLGWLNEHTRTNHYIISMINKGEFDFKCPECDGSEINEMCDDPYYSEPCACTVDWRGEALKNALEVRQLRDGNKLFAETLLIKDEMQKLLIEVRDKLVKALAWYDGKECAEIVRRYYFGQTLFDDLGLRARVVLSEIKGEGDETNG